METIKINDQECKLSELTTKQLRNLLACGYRGDQYNAIMLEYRHRPDKKVKR